MKGYKAFEKGLICKGKQYAENTVFEEEKAEICNAGMHFCENPFDCLDYYPLVNNEGEMSDFAEVEALDEVKTDDNKKFCTKKLKIGTKLNLAGFIKASVDFLYEKTIKNMPKSKVKDGNYARIGSSGNYARIGSSGDYARIGSSGDSAQIGSSGDSARIISEGKNAVIMCAGNGSIAKGKIGSWITLAEWKNVNGDYTPVCVKTKRIDGIKIKEDTFYILHNGRFKEIEQ